MSLNIYAFNYEKEPTEAAYLAILSPEVFNFYVAILDILYERDYDIFKEPLGIAKNVQNQKYEEIIQNDGHCIF